MGIVIFIFVVLFLILDIYILVITIEFLTDVPKHLSEISDSLDSIARELKERL